MRVNNQTQKHIKSLIFLLLFAVITISNGCSSKKNVQGANLGYDLYLLVGQSNMAGRGVIEPEDTETHARVFALNAADEFVLAKEPLHFDKKNRGTGPGLAFGKAMADANPKAKIGLIPAAVGGTKISYWKPGSSRGLYEEAIRKAKVAMKQGQLKGIVWQQGESDSNSKDGPLYKERLIELMNAFRKDLEDKKVPIIIGGLGDFLNRNYKVVEKALQEASTELPNAGFSEASKLGHIGDNLHFNAKAQRENGRNMAKAMLKLQK